MVAIWRLTWALAALGLLPLAIAGDAHIATRTPVRLQGALPPPPEPVRRYTVCGIAGAENCWEVVGVPMR